MAAENAATISGEVLSSDGKPVNGAYIALYGNGRGVAGTTTAGGVFHISDVPVGTYTVKVSAPGYNPITADIVQLHADANTIDFNLVRLQASSLTEIGSIRANGSRAISTLPAATADIPMKAYAQQGVTAVSTVLAGQLSTTVVPVIGGGLNAPAVVSLRGPDPSETLVDIDGHQVNNGSTGDFDLSLLDPADLSSTQVVYGVAPSSLYGPNTLGGALNVRTLEPTANQHTLERFTVGSYGTYGETLQATGTADRLGYAVSYHRLTSAGDQVGALFPNSSDGQGVSTGTSPIGDALDATSTITKLRYSLWNGAGFVGVSMRDQAVYRDVSATMSSINLGAGVNGGNGYSNFSGTSDNSHNASYDIDAQAPIGPKNTAGMYPTTILIRHQTSLADQSVNGPGADTSPYLYNDRDTIADDTVEIDHALPKGSLSARYAVTTEKLTTDFLPGVLYADSELRAPAGVAIADDVASSPSATSSSRSLADSSSGVAQQALGQVEHSLGIRYAIEPTSHLHYTFAGYFSHYSTFGTSTDPRFGFVWTPNADTGYRFSVGSTFQSPQLPTFVVPPTLPQPVDGYVSVGNPNATAERATSYDIGFDHKLKVHGKNLRIGGDLYRTNLHNGVATYTPATQCTNNVPSPACETYPVNVTQEVYQGAELHGELALAPHDSLHAAYDIDSVYTQAVPVNDNGDVPNFEQSLGVPLHKITLDYAHDNDNGIAYDAGLLYEGSYNETNLGPYATLHASVTLHQRACEITLAGTNLTNVYAFKQQIVGGGIPYGGLSGTEPTNAIPLAPRTITLAITHKT